MSAEAQGGLAAAISLVRQAQTNLRTSISSKGSTKAALLQELASLRESDGGFDRQYVAEATKLNALQTLLQNLAKEAFSGKDVTSLTELAKLDALEKDVWTLEQQMFGLVPTIGAPQTKTQLAVLTGKCDELQAKRVDAIQARGLQAQDVILARRKSLAKRLDILSNLGITLHKIADRE